MRNIDRKNKINLKTIVVFVAITVSLCMLLGSCGMLNTLYEMKNDEEGFTNTMSEGHQTEQANAETEEAGNPEGLVIEKEESTAQEGDGLTSAGQPYNDITKVYYAVSDSVVEITTETVQNSGWMGEYVSKGAGSGVIIDKSGIIVTNNHVIEGANNVTVRLTDGSEYSATLIGTDAAADLAVIKINVGEKELCVAPLGCSSDLVVGEDVIALGNPLGSLGGTLTTGIISATERIITIDGEEMVLLQTNAAINPGNSGGGLFNMAGELVGIVNAKASGEDVEGLGFAIPIDYAYSVIQDLVNYGYVRGVVDMGLTLLDVTAQNLPAAYYKYGITTAGIIVIESRHTDEIKYGDRIISVNGIEVKSLTDIERILKSCRVGDKIRVAVVREDNVIEVEYELKEKVPEKITFEG